MGGVDLCEQREAKTRGEGQSISVDREAKTVGGEIDFCERDQNRGFL